MSTTRPHGSRRFTRLVWTLALLTLAGGVGVGHAFAQVPDDEPAPAREQQADEADEAAATTGEEAEASDEREDAGEPDESEELDETDEAIDQLMQQRQAPPTVAPTRTSEGEAAPTTQVDVDRSVLGVAPGEQQPDLRREGEFIVNRHGYLRRSADGAHMLFVFNADDRDSPETPMVLQPCQLLETMENIVQQRGDQVTFILSGQVHTYRGANYLLPTMMNIDVERDDLE